MSALSFENEAEAVACVAALMIAADGIGTEDEVNFLFDRVSTIPVFAGYDSKGFRELVGKVSAAMHGAITQNDDGTITDAGLDTVAHAVKATVAPGNWTMVAEAVARSDGLDDAEQRVLDHFANILK